MNELLEIMPADEKKKVAVIVSGLARNEKTADFCLHNIIKAFPDADIYATYWDNSPEPPEENIKSVNIGRGIVCLPAPNFPEEYGGLAKFSFLPDWWNLPLYANRTDTKFMYLTLQLLAHALTKVLLVDEEKYDLIVRTRWDAAFNPLEPWAKHVHKCCTNRSILGFKSIVNTHIKEYRTLFDTNLSVPLKLPVDPSYFLPPLIEDFCIMYPPKAFDSVKTIELFKTKELLGGEMGWSQMLLHNNSFHYQWENRVGGVFRISGL